LIEKSLPEAQNRVEVQRSGFSVLGSGFWILDSGFWILHRRWPLFRLAAGLTPET